VGIKVISTTDSTLLFA